MTTLQVLPQPSPFGAGSVPAPAFEGPLDLVPGAVFAVGNRALSLGWLGQPLYTLRRDSDNTLQAFNADGTTGDPDSAAITTFVGGGTGLLHTWNDQAGGGFDVIQDAFILQAQWLASAFDSKPGFRADDPVNDYYASTAHGIDFPDGEATVFVVCNADAEVQLGNAIGQYLDFYTGATGGHLAYIDLNDNGSNDAEFNFAALTSAVKIVDNVIAFGTTGFKVNGAPSVIVTDGSSGAGPVVLPILNTQATVRVRAGADAGTTSSTLIEAIVYPFVLTDAQRLLVRQNIAVYYGVTLP